MHHHNAADIFMFTENIILDFMMIGEGKEGLVLCSDVDGPCYSLLHPIDRVHNIAINNPVIPLVPI